MTMRGGQSRSGEGFFSTVVVKPTLTRLEARDDRVPGGGVMFRRMLIWRTVAAPDVTTFGASAKMEPPFALSQAFDAARTAWLGRGVDTVSHGLHRSSQP